MLDFDAIQAASRRLHGQVEETPCLHSRTLSALTGVELFLKFENLQFTASFKERGAGNKLALMTPAERARGVVAMSAGNHAQGVAFHAQRLGTRAVIVMPRFTPDIKVSGTRALGAEIVLHGDSLAEARARARELATAEQLEFIHPYNDEAIMAGQGTVGLEMLRQQPELEVLLVPVGGGGLLSGIATAAKALNPEIQVIGVQMQRFPAVVNAMTGSHHGFGQDTIAEGIAVARPGEKCLESIRRHVDDFLLVDESDVEEAIVMLLEIEKTVVEGAGAAPLAALLRHRQRFFGKKVGIVLSGGNVDPQLLSQIIGRGLVRSGRMARITVSTRDVPGALARITALVAESGANVEQVIHQRAFTLLAARNVEVEMVLHTRDIAHVAQVSQHLQDQGFEVRVMHPRDARLPQ